MSRLLPLLALLVSTSPAAMQSPVGVQEFAEVARLAGDESRGAALAGQVCASCHGRDAGGSTDGEIPAIAGQHRRVIARQLIDFRHADRRDARMEEVAGTHGLRDARDIADLAAYLSVLPLTRRTVQGDGHAVDAGRERYQRSCSGCHGDAAEGNDQMLVPRLAGQHFPYLRRQLLDAVDGRRPAVPSPHPQLLGEWSVDDYAGLADYLSRLPAR